MPTIVDQLIVTLGIDASGFVTGKGKVDSSLQDTGRKADKTGVQFDKMGKAGAQGFEVVAKQAAKLFALFGGTYAIKRFIDQTTESTAALGRFAANIGESVSTASAWGNAAEMLGGSAGGIQSAMSALSMAQTQMQMGTEPAMLKYLNLLGVGFEGIGGGAAGQSEKLFRISDALRGIAQNPIFGRPGAFNIGKMMGFDDSAVNLLLAGRDAIRESQKYAATPEQQAQADRLQKQMVEISQSFDALGRSIMLDAEPALKEFYADAKALVGFLTDNKANVEGFFSGIGRFLHGAAYQAIAVGDAIVGVLTGDQARIEHAYREYANPLTSTIGSSDSNQPATKTPWAPGLAPQLPEQNPGPLTSGDRNNPGPLTSGDRNSPSLAIRSNNPGNIKFMGQPGASPGYTFPDQTRQAEWPTVEAGYAGLANDLRAKIRGGLNTIDKILPVYAPSKENDTASYIANLSRMSGVAPNQVIDPNNAVQMAALMRGITTIEDNRNKTSDQQIYGGLRMAGPTIPMPTASAMAQTTAAGIANNQTSNQNAVHVGSVNFHVAEGMPPEKILGAWDDWIYTWQSNTGQR